MKALASTSEALIRLTHNLSAVLLALASILVFYQVITRFVLGDAAAWSEILARAVIIWTVFMVSGAAIRFGQMIPIDAIKNMAPKRAQIWLTRLVTIATLLATSTIFLLLGWTDLTGKIAALTEYMDTELARRRLWT